MEKQAVINESNTPPESESCCTDKTAQAVDTKCEDKDSKLEDHVTKRAADAVTRACCCKG